MLNSPLDYATPPARPGRQTSVLLVVLAAIAGAVIISALAMEIQAISLPWRYRAWFEPLMVSTAQAGAEVGSRRVANSGGLGGLRAETFDHREIILPDSALLGGIGMMPLMLVASVGLSWSAARQWRLGRVSEMVLPVTAAGLVLLGWPAMSGFLRGVGLASEFDLRLGGLIDRVAEDAAPMAACALIALSWQIAHWVRDRSAPRANTFAPTRPPSIWAATAAAGVGSGIWALALVAAIAMLNTSMADSDVAAWRVARTLACAGSIWLSAGLLVAALIRGRPARWAWAPLLVLVLVGGEPAGAITFLLAAACARGASWELPASTSEASTR